MMLYTRRINEMAVTELYIIINLPFCSHLIAKELPKQHLVVILNTNNNH